MKKILSVLLALLVAFMPLFGVSAKEEKEKINFYIFYGDGCGYCAALHSYTDQLQKDKNYKDMFNIVDYEVWKNQENATLMSNVGAYFKTEVTGVPFYVIGDQYFSGFSDQSSPAQIEAAIKKAYENKDYVDIVAGIGEGTISVKDGDLNEKDTSKENNIVGYIILGITAIIVVAIIFGRDKDTYYDEEEVEEVEEETETEEEEEEVVEEKPKKVIKKSAEKTTTKSTTAKKSTTKSSASKSTAKKKAGSKTNSKKKK
jgi:thiol-disulfide isomerase/thioredoxin